MSTQKQIPLPPKGYRKQLAIAAGCTEKTVTDALRHNAVGYKSDKVRELYHSLYVKPYLKKEIKKE